MRRLIILATGFILFIIIILGLTLLISRSQKWILFIMVSLTFSLLSGYNLIISGIQNVARQRAVVFLHQGMEYWTRFMIAAGLILWLGASSVVAMIGFTISGMMVLGSQFIFFCKKIPRKEIRAINETNWQKRILAYSWPFAAWGIFSWAQLASDRWALEYFTMTQDVGRYAALFQLGYYPMSMASGMIMQFFIPFFYQQAGDDAKDHQRFAAVNLMSRHLIEVTLIITIFFVTVAFFLHREIFQIFLSREYLSVSYLLPWMLLAGGISAAGQTMTLNLMSQMKTRSLMGIKIFTAILGVLLNGFGAYWFGITGIVFANILASLSYFIWMKKISKESNPGIG